VCLGDAVDSNLTPAEQALEHKKKGGELFGNGDFNGAIQAFSLAIQCAPGVRPRKTF